MNEKEDFVQIRGGHVEVPPDGKILVAVLCFNITFKNNKTRFSLNLYPEKKIYSSLLVSYLVTDFNPFLL